MTMKQLVTLLRPDRAAHQRDIDSFYIGLERVFGPTIDLDRVFGRPNDQNRMGDHQ